MFVEVKSTNDRATIKDNIEMVADSKTVKNHKRTAQHQLRDHLEILKTDLGYAVSDEIQCYIMWPFLGEITTDPKQQVGILKYVFSSISRAFRKCQVHLRAVADCEKVGRRR